MSFRYMMIDMTWFDTIWWKNLYIVHNDVDPFLVIQMNELIGLNLNTTSKILLVNRKCFHGTNRVLSRCYRLWCNSQNWIVEQPAWRHNFVCCHNLLWCQSWLMLKDIFSDSNNIFLWHETKKIKSKISVDSNFTFSSYAWLSVFHCSHRLLC